MQDSPRRGPVDPQVAAVLEKIRLAGKPEYWQMTPAQAREWHNRKAGILDIAPEAGSATASRSVEPKMIASSPGPPTNVSLPSSGALHVVAERVDTLKREIGCK